MKFLITGHTGFKGAWLSLMLKSLGHEVSGLSLQPIPNSLYAKCSLEDIFSENFFCDIRDSNLVKRAVEQTDPDFIFHLAAQPLVISSYLKPGETFETNVFGTLNLLEAATKSQKIQGFLAVTTDKVYGNSSIEEPRAETDPLCGDDPYSASKAMADIMVQSWAKTFPNKTFAIARAGNVIGGGDVSPMRLMTDITEAYEKNSPLEIRNPNSVRPWQHVLDCLQGYLRLSELMISESIGGAWNFGPNSSQSVTVNEIVKYSEGFLGTKFLVNQVDATVNETKVLRLDSRKANENLNWKNKLDFPESLQWTLTWYKEVWMGKNVRKVTEDQIEDYLHLVRD